MPLKDLPEEEQRARIRRSLARLFLVALVATVVLIFFVPIRCTIPWTFTVLFEPGFTGPFRVVADGNCPGALVRDGLNYTVRIPASGQVTVGRAVFLSPPRRGRYVGAGEPLPEIGRNTSSSPGISPLNLRSDDQRWTLIGFVGTTPEYEQFGGYPALLEVFKDAPQLQCDSGR